MHVTVQEYEFPPMSHTTGLLAPYGACAPTACLAKPMPPHAGRQQNTLGHSLGAL